MRPGSCTTAIAALSLVACQTQLVNSLEPRPIQDAGADAPYCPSGGNALSFDGVGARVVADLGGALPTGNTSRTVEMWVYARPSSWAVNRHTLFEYGLNTLHQAFAIDMEPFPMMQIYSWDDDLFFDAGIGMEGWFHVATTYDGTTLRAFINGNERGSKSPMAVLSTVQTTVKIAWSPYTSAHFDGMIDEVRIWAIDRTADEIKSNMSVRLNGDEPWLVAYWPFDEGEGTIAYDASSRHHDATLELGPQWVPSGVTLSCP